MIQGEQIQSEIAVRLLGVKVDHRLTIDDHISDLCRKAAAQLNALKRLTGYMEFYSQRDLGSKLRLFEFDLLPVGMAFFITKSPFVI